MQEFVDKLLLGERVDVDLAAGAGPRLICVDSGANIFILNFLLKIFVNFVHVMNRNIRTATAEGRLRVEALFDAPQRKFVIVLRPQSDSHKHYLSV